MTWPLLMAWRFFVCACLSLDSVCLYFVIIILSTINLRKNFDNFLWLWVLICCLCDCVRYFNFPHTRCHIFECLFLLHLFTVPAAAAFLWCIIADVFCCVFSVTFAVGVAVFFADDSSFFLLMFFPAVFCWRFFADAADIATVFLPEFFSWYYN